MVNYEVINQKPVHSSKVYEEITSKTQNREQTYREEKILEYLKKTNKLEQKEFKSALDELKALEIPRIEEKHLVKILEIMPQNGTELRAIISHGGVVVVDDVVTQILEIIKKYS